MEKGRRVTQTIPPFIPPDWRKRNFAMSPHFKPTFAALVLIDYQVGTMQLIKNQTPDTALRNALISARTALAFDIPIVVTSSQEDRIRGPIAGALQRAMPAGCNVKRAGIVDACNGPHSKSPCRPSVVNS